MKCCHGIKHTEEDGYEWCEDWNLYECEYGQSGNCICPVDLWNWKVNRD